MFKKARFKLTAWYLLIIMVISFLFSAIIYQINCTEINRFANSQSIRIQGRLFSPDPNSPPPMITLIDDDLINESQNRLLINLGIINGIIFIISGSFAYFLAGRTLSPIKKMLEDQKQFISDASHELKTPITALKTMLEVSLRDPNLDLIESKKVLTDATLATDQLKTLSDSILQLNHLTNNGSSFKLEPILINKLISESVKKIKPQADKKKITIKFNQIKGKIIVDSQKIEELLLILLDNAIKYSPDSSSINFIAVKTNKHLILKVIDKGIGISQKDLPHIFDRFYRADNARTKDNSTSYGLGLSIALKIVEQHHGSIGVQSIPQKGSTFKVKLPL